MLSYFHYVPLDMALFLPCGMCHESCNYTDAEHAMKSTQANGRLSSIAASHSGHSELSSIADDQPAYQLTGNHQPAAAGSRIE